MPNDKAIKAEFKQKASKDPDRYYATGVLKKEGFVRKQCTCKTFYWTAVDAKTCGDPACSGGFRFIGDTPSKKELSYIDCWKEFSSMFRKMGYTPIKRYPVMARWRTDTEFVQASIYDFQPYVVSGEVDPPANPLVVPQFCLRFNDIDNVGVTGAHYTGFVMIGQHAFMPPERWDQAKYFSDIHTWLKKGLGLPNEEITFHEDAWAGGGNFGPCMEFFSRGLEIGNQVYMMYEVMPSGSKELKLKVLDMGSGLERNAWFTKGTSTSYESTFPTVCKKLFGATGLKIDAQLMKRFLPYSSYLNVDEVDDIDKVWDNVAQKVGMETFKLKATIQEVAALLSIAEHSRSLLVALSDGGLPSNVGGGYNLRAILRRALAFIDRYGWNLSLPEICGWHAEYLKPLFPELKENLKEVAEILEVEKAKYGATKQKTRQVVEKIIKDEITEGKLLELYDSQGISPELVREEAQKLGKQVKVPDNFYARVAELHEKKEQEHQTQREEKLDLAGVPETKALYYDDYRKHHFTAKVLKIIGNKVILDTTYFYATSGGQLHDTGVLGGVRVIDVFRQGKVIVHVLESTPAFRIGELVEGEIDIERRTQLAQHHTATHIVNAAARMVLGKHINQASARKTPEKATIDITHYEALSEEQLKKIEDAANKIVKDKLPVTSSFVPRTEAEQKYGVGIYQGGVAPGKLLRIVNIADQDIEACGGTHLHNTAEAGEIKILKSTKISDGIVRLTYVAGKAAEREEGTEHTMLAETAKLLHCTVPQLPGRAAELFEKWKQGVKKGKQVDKALQSTEEFQGSLNDLVVKLCEIYKVQPEHIVRTTKRFLEELERV